MPGKRCVAISATLQEKTETPLDAHLFFRLKTKKIGTQENDNIKPSIPCRDCFTPPHLWHFWKKDIK
jgi:hypothetical protein